MKADKAARVAFGPALERADLVPCLEDLAAAMDRGEITPEPDGLRALEEVCELSGCSDLAARVRRWRGIA